MRARLVGARIIQKRFKDGRIQPLQKIVHSELTDLWQDAVEAFIRSAIRRVLVETGMSTATFFPLSRAVNRGSQYIIGHLAERQKKTSRKGIPQFPDGKRGPGLQNIPSGRAAGEKAYIIEIGTPSSPKFIFEFETAVWQFAYHEKHEKALEAGQIAFLETVKAEFLKRMSLVLAKYLLPGRR